MKFVYEYRTSDNIRHEGVVAAANREAAFATLKKQGIRPGALHDAPGFFNILFGRGKRWLAIGVLAFLCAGLMAVVGRGLRFSQQAAALSDSLDAPMRRQPIGDAAIIAKGIRTGWSDVFALEGDRFLASFAVPGVPVAVRNTTEERIREALNAGRQSLDVQSVSIEARQILAIVAGMKDELRNFIADGGSVREYCDCLVRRQNQEIGYYDRAKLEMETAAKSGVPLEILERMLEEKNAALRALGVRLVPMPE